MPAAEGSEKTPIENQQDIFLTGKIGKRDAVAAKIGQSKRRGRCVERDSGHGGFLTFDIIDRQ